MRLSELFLQFDNLIVFTCNMKKKILKVVLVYLDIRGGNLVNYCRADFYSTVLCIIYVQL